MSDLYMDSLTATAFHEAGHAVVAAHLGIPVRYMTIYSTRTTWNPYPHVAIDGALDDLPEVVSIIGAEEVNEDFALRLFPKSEDDGLTTYGRGTTELDGYEESDQSGTLDEYDEAEEFDMSDEGYEAFLDHRADRRQAALDWLEDRILLSLAGLVAEEIVTGEWRSEHAQGDMMIIAQLVRKTFDQDDPALVAPVVDGVADFVPVARRIKERWGEATRELLVEIWPWVEAVARAAKDGDGSLTGEHIDALRPAYRA
jgi:hypothetical protein